MIARFNIQKRDGYFDLIAELADLTFDKISHFELVRQLDGLDLLILQHTGSIPVNDLERLHMRQGTHHFTCNAIGEPAIILRRGEIFEGQDHQRFLIALLLLHDLRCLRRARGFEAKFPEGADDRIYVRHRRALDASKSILQITR